MKRLTALLAVMGLLFAQAAASAHDREHSDHDDIAACEFCIVASLLDHADASDVSICIDGPEAPHFDAALSSHAVCLSPRAGKARSPPTS